MIKKKWPVANVQLLSRVFIRFPEKIFLDK
jgi:hypothetical protein